jgi:hypothetical protein
LTDAGPTIVALSGGVDSAVTALLLLRAGYAVQGLFMHNWDDDEEGYCTSAQDFQDARAVAQVLGIPLHSVDLSAQYRARVFAHFLAEYQAGRTPNPDVLCNREIKFGDCLAHARRLGAAWLATGHYARIEQRADGPALLKGVDGGKDQSYFLHAVPRAQFRQVLMPLGELHARNTGLVRRLMMIRVKEASAPCARSASTHALSGSTCGTPTDARVLSSPNWRCTMVDWYVVSAFSCHRESSSLESMRSSCTSSSPAVCVTMVTSSPRKKLAFLLPTPKKLSWLLRKRSLAPGDRLWLCCCTVTTATVTSARCLSATV